MAIGGSLTIESRSMVLATRSVRAITLRSRSSTT